MLGRIDALAADGSIILWLGLFMLGCALALLVAAAFRSNELFRIVVEGGQPRLARGRLPPALFDDLCVVIRRENLQEAVIRVVLQGGEPRLALRADANAAAQALRNVLGQFSLVQLRTGRLRAGQHR